MKYDVIKSTDQLMGIWGLGKVEKKDSDTKMIPHTKLEDYCREVSHGNRLKALKLAIQEPDVPEADFGDIPSATAH